ncbi:MAG TPA: endonuclease V [Candidatus Limnocylindrales bacterium]|nr:endonuclease V [Candidatus Limnocylindrales bacterium]
MISRKTVTGLDVSYEEGTKRAVAAAVTLELPTLDVVEVALFDGEVQAPYAAGFLALREAPLLLRALEQLKSRPEVFVCDGYGIAHPRRFGLACHIGRETGRPTFGVAKTPFMARFSEPGPERGAWSDLLDGQDVVGRALRTRPGVKPVFVSVGQGIDIEEATELTLAMCPKYRQPECIREADSRSRAALRR